MQIRDLHWHKAAEWSIMLYGTARITGVDAQGRSFVDDIGIGDLWYFPAGIPHSIQGLGPDAAEFLLVFDDGHVSEYETVLLSSVAAHTPRDVLAGTSGIGVQQLQRFPEEKLFIFQAPVPGPLDIDRQQAAEDEESSPCGFSFRPAEQCDLKKFPGGEVRIVDSTSFRKSTTVATAIVTVHEGCMRELHWHQNADEWQYISGKGRMTVIGTGERARTMDFESGDVGYIEKTLPHHVENTGKEDLRYLEVFRAPRFEDLSLAQWLSHTPAKLVMAHLNIDRQSYRQIPKEKTVLIGR